MGWNPGEPVEDGLGEAMAGLGEAIAGLREAELGIPPIQDFSHHHSSAWSLVLLMRDFFQASPRLPSW